jgi:hypothetical protein
MLKISTVDCRRQRRLVLEGQLLAPWTAELRMAWLAAIADLHKRELVVDLENLTAISMEGEDVLFELMSQGARFHCRGVLTKSIVRQLARKLRQIARANTDMKEITE